MALRYFKTVLALALLISTSLTTKAAPIVYQYGFENLCGNLCTTASPWTGTPDVLANGLSSSSWATNYSGGFISYAGSCGSTSCQALSLSHNNYPSSTTYSLTFTVAAGKELSIAGLSFWDKESGTGPTTANITINGTAAVSNHTLSGTTGANSGLLTPITTFTHLTGTVTLVITLTGATGTTGTFRLDDFVINGSVTTPGLNNYNVTGGGNLCAGNSGLAIGLDGSDTGVTYQLKNAGNVNVASPVAGTGSAISFGLQTAAGIYTVLATNDTSSATATMVGSATITVHQPPVVNLGTVAPQCGGSVNLDAGNAGSTFLWSDNSILQTDAVNTTANYSVTVTDTAGCSATASVSVTINTPPSLSFTATELTICAGHPSTITASGANTYVWSNSATTDAVTVQPGASITYSVTGTDVSNCTASGTASLNVLPSKTDTVTTQICQGLSYNGHTLPGTYSDTLTASGGCDSIVSVNLAVLPVSTSNLTQTICAGQSFDGHSSSGTFSDTLTSATGCDSIITLQLTVTAPVATSIPQTICYGQTYNGFSTSGTFNDTLTAASGCDSIVSLTLTVLPEISMALRHSICHGDTFMGHAAGGNFTDTLTAANGCDSLVYLQLTVNALPHVTLYLAFDTVCSNASPVNMSGGLPAGGYYSGTGINNSQFNPSAAPLGKDTIYYNYTDSNGCFKNRYEFAFVETCTDTTAAINEVNNVAFHISPNPTQDFLTIEPTGLNAPFTISLYDLLGRLILSQPSDGNKISEKTSLDLRQLPAGLYLLNVTQGNSKVHSFRIVKD